jgi:hypothetical protein
MRFRDGSLFVVSLLLVGLLTTLQAQSSSANYTLQQSTNNSAGDVATSAGYRMTPSLGQEATIGASSSPGFVLQSGFWSFLGSGLVPVFLSVNKNGIDPEDMDLSWSGNNDPYDLYRSANCTDVFAAYLDTTVTNDFTDVTTPAASLLCYSVLATAPGPAPPPPTP